MERDFLGLSSKNVSVTVKEEVNDDSMSSGMVFISSFSNFLQLGNYNCRFWRLQIAFLLLLEPSYDLSCLNSLRVMIYKMNTVSV